jgi:hypothetical protein
MLVKATTILDKLEFQGFTWDKVDMVDPMVALLTADVDATDVVLAEKIFSHGLTQGLIKPKPDSSNVAAMMAGGLGPMGGMMPMLAGQAMVGAGVNMGQGGMAAQAAQQQYLLSQQQLMLQQQAAALAGGLSGVPPVPGMASGLGGMGMSLGLQGPAATAQNGQMPAFVVGSAMGGAAVPLPGAPQPWVGQGGLGVVTGSGQGGKKVKCFSCGGEGHYANRCPTRGNTYGGQVAASQPR